MFGSICRRLAEARAETETETENREIFGSICESPHNWPEAHLSRARSLHRPAHQHKPHINYLPAGFAIDLYRLRTTEPAYRSSVCGGGGGLMI